MNENNLNRLLVIDDEPEICELIKNVAEEIDFDVSVATTATEFQSCVRECKPGVIVLDLQMPQVDGIELLRFLGEEKCSAGVILISGTDKRVLATSRRLGDSYGLNMLGALQKPIKLNDLEQILEQSR
ncbi:MAG: response regulator [Rhodospirillales bacterium]|nr:response regulator [Rhodospirillales bacterium]